MEYGLPSNLYFVIRTQWNRKDSAGLITEALGEGDSPSRLKETLGHDVSLLSLPTGSGLPHTLTGIKERTIPHEESIFTNVILATNSLIWTTIQHP